MATLNKVFLIGNVGSDPEIKPVQGGAKVASFRLATTTRYTDRSGNKQEETEWHTITAWNNKADFVEKFVHKGGTLYIEGRIKTRSWTDQQNTKHYATEVVADNFQLLDKPGQNTQALGPDEDLPEFLR